MHQMLAEFVKMHGGGNDFVFIDNTSGCHASFSPENARALCDRRRGIGADGVVLLEPATSPSSACSWRFFNRDGSIAEMCGNGARCFAAFARRCGIVTGKEPFTFDTVAGAVSAQFIDDDQVAVGLTQPRGYVCFPPGLGGVSALGACHWHYIDTGVPHVVAFVPDVASVDVMGIGSIIRRCGELQPQGANVNFAQRMPADCDAGHAQPWLRVRTFERGVEAETQACGTGVAACALIAAMTSVDSPPNERFSSPITVGNLNTPSSHDVPHHYSQLPPCLALPQSCVMQVLTAGGDALRVLFVAAEKLLAGHEGQLTHVRVIGPYAEVFRGSINVSALSET